ncbi:hypothetical protein HGRIS_011681 [Hohenbuehelia grisea]|uniref:RRM domain-containing protein n=1 Tax=Hohenbuehelia grisea TaxID=104357 RepID=A0ABR3JVV0_9AGAR
MHATQRQMSKGMHQFHKSKQSVVGNQAGHAPPSWRPNGMSAALSSTKGKQPAQDVGSKILLSMLPQDVSEAEIEELFKKTVGPIRDAFVIYNSQARSKGMAVVTFQRSGDAAAARAKFHGKIVDGRRPIKIEIVVDSEKAPASAPPPPPGPPSLFSRLSAPVNGKTTTSPAMSAPASPRPINVTPRAANPPRAAPPVRANQSQPIPIPPRKVRQKKGARRLNKRVKPEKKTKEDLDKEMEDYQAQAL